MRFSWGRAGVAVLLVAALSVSGCAGRWAYRQGRDAARQGDWDLAVARLTRAVQNDPDNLDYKFALENARLQASRHHYDKARQHTSAYDFERAAEELEVATKYDPANQAYKDELRIVQEQIEKREEEQRSRSDFEEMRRRADAATAPVRTLSPRSPVPIQLNFPDASLQKVFDTMGQLAGVNVLYDEAFRDKQVTVRITGVTFQEALDQLTSTNRFFYRVVDGNTIIIIPDTPQKRRSYDETLVRTFYIQYADVNELLTVIRNLTGITKIAPSKDLGAITALGTPDELALAARIVESVDRPKGEVVVEIQIIDVKRTNLKNYGIQLANHEGSVAFAPHANPDGNSTSIRAHLLSSLNLADFVVNIPSRVFFRFLQTDTTARILAAPRLRAAEGKQTSLRIGTEVPIPVTSFTTPSVNPGQNFGSATSFQYRNVGINMDITPRVNASGDITLELAAEFSLIGANRDVGGGLSVPEFLTRNVKGLVRVKDGETSLIGGLIQGEESDAFTGIFGLQSVPILNRLLTSPNKSRADTEVLISLTPHIVRGPKLRENDLIAIAAGTKERIEVRGARPPLFGPEEPTPAPTPVSGDPPPAAVPTPAPPPGTEAAPAAPPTPAPATPAPAAGTGPPASAAMVLFSPPEITVKQDEMQTLAIVVLRAKDLQGIEFVVSFDPTLVEGMDVMPGSFLTLDGSSVSIERGLENGRMRARLTRENGTAGSGAVATLQIKGLRPGQATLNVDSLSLITATGVERAAMPGPARVVVTP